MKPGGPITIKDVARASGVTPSTVSRALNQGPRIAASTRARVLAAVDELGYRPSRAARSLRVARTQTIGLLAPNLANPVAYAYMHGAVRAAYELGYAVFTADGQGSATVQEALLTRLLEHRVDGLLLGPGILHLNRRLADALESQIPIEPPFEVPQDIGLAAAQVATPDPRRATLEEHAALAAYRKLIALGHRRFAFIQLVVGAGTRLGFSRLELLKRSLSEAGLGADALRYVPIRSDDGTGSPAECVREITQLLGRDDRPSAIVNGNHVTTPHLLRGIRDAGLRMPVDLSFVTYGDSEWAAAYIPAIASIRHDQGASGERDLRRLIARAEGTPIPESAVPPTEFLPRGSIGPAPGWVTDS